MEKLLEEIQAEALLLPPEDRERLAGALLDSLDQEPLSEIERAWIAEAERRYENWRTGKSTPIPGEHFISGIRRELGLSPDQGHSNDPRPT